MTKIASLSALWSELKSKSGKVKKDGKREATGSRVRAKDSREQGKEVGGSVKGEEKMRR